MAGKRTAVDDKKLEAKARKWAQITDNGWFNASCAERERAFFTFAKQAQKKGYERGVRESAAKTHPEHYYWPVEWAHSKVALAIKADILSLLKRDRKNRGKVK